MEYGEGNDSRVLRFDGALEVEGVRTGQPFSDGGDSGSLVVDDQKFAVGLLFAGADTTTYINPIELVLQELRVVLVK